MMSSAMAHEVLSLGAAVVVRATVLLTGAFLISSLLRRSSALSRHTLWTVTLAAVLVLPALVVAGPRVDVPVPGWRAGPSSPAGPSAPEASAVVPTGASVDGSIGAANTSRLTAPGSGRTGPGAALSNSGRPMPENVSWVVLLLLAWGGGGLLVAAAIAIGFWRAGRIARHAEPVTDPSLLSSLHRARVRLGVRRPVELRLSSSVATPMTGGIRRSVILLPSSAEQWTRERRELVLAHELVHIKRFDAARQLLNRLATSLYWFHPLAWLARRSALLAREEACDEAVIELGCKPSTYARHLLALAEPTRLPFPALGGLARPQLERRLMAVLGKTRPRSRSRVTTATATAATVWALTVAAVSPRNDVGPLGVDDSVAFIVAPVSTSPGVEPPAAAAQSRECWADGIREMRGTLAVSRAVSRPNGFRDQVADLREEQREVRLAASAIPAAGDERAAALQRLRARKDRMTEAVSELERRLEREAGATDDPESTTALQEVARQIRESRLEEKLQYSRGTIEQWDARSADTLEQNIEENLQAVHDALELAERQAGVRDFGSPARRVGYDDADYFVQTSLDDAVLCMRVRAAVDMGREELGLESLAAGDWVVLAARATGNGRTIQLELTGTESGVRRVWFNGREEGRFGPTEAAWQDAMVTVLNGRREISGIRGQRSSLRGRISSIRGERSSLLGRISSIRGHVSSLRGQISSVRGRESALGGQISSARGHGSALQGRISSIRGRASSMRGEISSLRGRVAGLSSARRATDDPGTRARLEDEIAEVETVIADVREELAAYDVEARVAAVEEEIEAYDVQVVVSGLERAVAGQDVAARVREIEQEIEAYDADGRIAEVDRELEALGVERRVAELERQIEALDTERRIAEIEQRLRPHIERLQELIARLTGTPRELER